MPSEFYQNCRQEDLVKYCVEKDIVISQLVAALALKQPAQMNLPLGVKV